MPLNPPNRDRTQQAMATVLLKSIPAKNPAEIEAIYLRMNIWLIEMIEQGGLTSAQLNALSDNFLRTSLEKNEISTEQLLSAGLNPETAVRVGGAPPPPPGPPPGPPPTAHAGKCPEHPPSRTPERGILPR